MILVILAGVWALAFGHITITNALKMKGKDARIFGLALILVAAYLLPHLADFINGFAPSFITGNAAFASAFDMLIGALAIFATGWVMTNISPKLRIPSITVSVKRARN